MSFTENKLEISIAGMVIVFAAGLFHLFSGMQGRTQVEGDITYEMPRPKNFQGSDFDLSNREIERNYINPFEQRAAMQGLPKASDKTAQAKAKVAEQVKKNTATIGKKKSVVISRIVDANMQGAFTNEGSVPENKYANAANAANRKVATPAESANNTDADKEDTNKMSPDQWRALILAQPTKVNMDKLIQARNKDEVDATTYNTIIVDLLKNSNPVVQEVGLYGAKTFPTAESFVIVAQVEDTLPATQKAEAHAFLMSYGQGLRLSALMSVLQVSDQAVVAKATQVFVAGYQQAKSGTPISDVRSGRGEVSSSPMSGYLKFIPLFQRLAQSSDSALASLANSALAQIQTA